MQVDRFARGERAASLSAPRGWSSTVGESWAGDGLVGTSRALAGRLLGNLGARWQHTCGVAVRAACFADVVPQHDRSLLVAAAWLHDIGYAGSARRSGFHPLDGAWYLRRRGWDDLLVGLVAHHSGARFTAAARGLDGELEAFADPRFWTGGLADALTAADQTIGPDGLPMEVENRLADMLIRHGPGSPQARAHHLRAPVIRAAVADTERRLRAVSLTEALG